jgi:hypothetical protein
MKTLNQIEPRIDVATLSANPPYVIYQPGSYYLSKNISVTTGDAIEISADNVTLDLGGFAISSSKGGSGSGSGVSTSVAHNRLTIFNGTIDAAPGAGVGFASGIFITGAPKQILISDIQISGVSGNGIYMGFQGNVRHCTVSDCGSNGIVAEEVSDCCVLNASACGILGSVITGCRATTNATSLQYAIDAPIITNCVGETTLGTGLGGQTISHSTGTSTSGTGIFCTLADHCTGTTAGTTAGCIGLDAVSTADCCRGNGGGGASKALKASIAIGCSASGGSLDVPLGKQFNM